MAQDLANLMVNFEARNNQLLQKVDQNVNALNKLSRATKTPQKSAQSLSASFSSLGNVLSQAGLGDLASLFTRAGQGASLLENNLGRIGKGLSILGSGLKSTFSGVSGTLSSAATGVSNLGAAIKNVGLQGLSHTLSHSATAAKQFVSSFGGGAAGSMLGVGNVMGIGLVAGVSASFTRGWSKFLNYNVDEIPSDRMIPHDIWDRMNALRKISRKIGDIWSSPKEWTLSKSVKNVLPLLLKFKGILAGGALLIGPLLLQKIMVSLNNLAFRMVRSFSDLNIQARKLQVPPEVLKSWQEFSKIVGIDENVVGKAVTSLNNVLSEISGGGTSKKYAFDLLGMKAQDLRKNSPIDNLEEILKSVQKLDSESKKLSVMSAIFGPEDAKELLSVVDQLDSGFASVREKLDLTRYSKKNLQSVEDLRRATAELNLEWTDAMDGLKMNVGLPAVKGLNMALWAGVEAAKFLQSALLLLPRTVFDVGRAAFNLGKHFLAGAPEQAEKLNSEISKLKRTMSDLTSIPIGDLQPEKIGGLVEEYRNLIQTPVENFVRKLVELNKIYAEGYISGSDFYRIQAKINQEFLSSDPAIQKKSELIENYGFALDRLRKKMKTFAEEESMFGGLKGRDREMRGIFESFLDETVSGIDDMRLLARELAVIDPSSDLMKTMQSYMPELFSLKFPAILPQIEEFERKQDDLNMVFQNGLIGVKEYNSILREYYDAINVDSLSTFIDKMSYLDDLYESGAYSADQYLRKLGELNSSFSPGKNRIEEYQAALEGIRKEYEAGSFGQGEYRRRLSGLISGFQTSTIDEFNDKMALLYDNMTDLPKNMIQTEFLNIFGGLETSLENIKTKFNSLKDAFSKGLISRHAFQENVRALEDQRRDLLKITSFSMRDLEDQVSKIMSKSKPLPDFTRSIEGQSGTSLDFGIERFRGSLADRKARVAWDQEKTQRVLDFLSEIAENTQADGLAIYGG